MAALGMSLSSLVVVGNALRLGHGSVDSSASQDHPMTVLPLEEQPGR
jgi:hypothetical protein